jgi:hypothetical protein
MNDLISIDLPVSARGIERLSGKRVLYFIDKFANKLLTISRLIEDALRLAHDYRHLSYFEHALELLLHLALEQDYESKTQRAAGRSIILLDFTNN